MPAEVTSGTSQHGAPYPVQMSAKRARALFIVGMPRSGTKLLRELLNQSPSIRIMDIETDFFPFLVRWIEAHGEPRDPESFQKLHVAMRHAPYFAHRDKRGGFSWERWRECCRSFDAPGVFEGLARYETDIPVDANAVWGDKSPGYIRHLELLLAHFPDARVIHIVRDVRDYCVSMRKAWGKDIRRAAYLWARDVGRAHAICSSRPDACMEVKYESLLRTPSAELVKLCAFLGVEYSDDILRLRKASESVGDAKGKAEIVRDNFGKYARRLSRREIRDIESLAFDTMRKLGFTPTCATRARSMSAIEQRLRRIKDGVQLFQHDKKKWGWSGALRFHLTHGRMAN